MHPPLILTLAIDTPAFEYFNNLRQRYFPPSRNFLGAHLTLFHALPNDSAVIETVKKRAAQQRVFELEVLAPVSIGGGVAYKIKSDALAELHNTLQQLWWHYLRPQDKQKIWPHVTVQNKVSAGEAQQLLADLNASFAPFSTFGTGLQLWEYLNGPWNQLEIFNFEK